MKKSYIYIIMCTAALAFTACQSDDTADSDSNRMIMFTVDAEEVTTRAAEGYEDYTAHTNRPDNMGVYGYAGLASLSTMPASDAANTIFSNQKVTYKDEKWTYEPAKYWAGYASLLPFDFFSYMPQADGATITKSDDSYTVSFPVAIANGVTTNETALICHTPYHTELVGQTIPFQMDQTLTGFRLEFKLGDKMDEIRDFTITSVKITGDKDMFISAGTVSRTYTYSTDGWTAGDITWSNTSNPDTDPKISIDGVNLVLNDTEFQAWANNFYTIPAAGFTPTIEVTYNVTLNGTGAITTRENVTSTIKLCNTNFAKYDETKAGTIGEVLPIQIKIVPSYLYVLADDDLDSGYIVIK